MQTPSHLLLAGALSVPLRRRVSVSLPAVLVGSVLPDIPFTLLTIWGEIYYRWFAPLPQPGSIMEYLHFTLFFTDPLWIVAHNFFHSLLIASALLLVGLWGMRRRAGWGAWLFWMAASLLLHIIIDLLTHTSDGPLIWFPVNWSYHFASPVSYWERDAWGSLFIVGEYALDLVLLIYLARKFWPRGGARRA
ncbi:MAG: metal-dependent hydrolase [Caldilineaceae bacterium]|nr:metal-dependent hydrolase [Caldilineaceae bacterium]